MATRGGVLQAEEIVGTKCQGAEGAERARVAEGAEFREEEGEVGGARSHRPGEVNAN